LRPEDEEGQLRDRRSEVPDIGLANFTLPGELPHFKLRCGVQVKSATGIMASLPPANSIIHDPELVLQFHDLSFQAEDQAKAAYKNGYPLSDKGITWILLIGPYWLPKTFGPFSEDESTKKSLGSADFEATMGLLRGKNGPPPELEELYCLGTPESYTRLEEIIASTDELARPYIEAMSSDSKLLLFLSRPPCMS
jgi:hypothetical protein